MSIPHQRIRVFAKGNSIHIADSLFSIDGELEAIAGAGTQNVIVRTVRGRQRVLCAQYFNIYKEDNTNVWASTRDSTVTLLNALFNHTNPSDYADKSDTAASISSVNAEITNIKNTLKVDGDRGIYKDPTNPNQANVRLVTNSSLVVAASDKTRIDIGEASPGVIDFIVNSNTNVGPDTATTALTISGDASSAKASVALSANATLAGFNLAKLSDVFINSPSTGQVIKYDGAQWINGSDSSGTTLPTGGAEDAFLQKNSAANYDLKWSAYRMPTADGLDGQVLSTDGAGAVSFVYPKTISEDVKNVSGGPLLKGTPVHVTGSSGNAAEVVAADAATNYPAHFVLNEDLADEAEGQAIAIGFINNVDVPDASIYSEGQTVYLGASGGWVTTKPTGTNAIQNLGVIIKVNTTGNKISGIIMGAGRSNDVPNIPEGQTWIGNASGVATPTTLSDVATSGAYSDLSGTPTIPVSGVDFDPVGTDNSTDVTLAGTYDYLTLSGQQITLGQVDYSTDVSNKPSIPVSGADFDPVGTDNSTDATVGATASDVLKMAAGQVLGAFDAGVDKLVFWDDSESKLTYATIGTNLTMTSATLDASGGGANMENSASAPTNAGEFNDGARLLTSVYGTSPSATAGNVVNLANTNASDVGAASVAAAATGMILMVTDAATGDELLIEGVIRLSSATTTALLPTTAKRGAPVYMSTTAGAVTNVAPSTAGQFVRVVGHVLDATNRTIYFKPDNTWLEL